MTSPELAPRPAFHGVVAVWVLALAVAVAIAVFVPVDRQAVWFTLALAGLFVAGIVVQLFYGRSVGFIRRVAASALGALVALGVVSAAVGLATII
ncbi:hypothetical protein M4I32_04010 [Microbacterium sp. LRZ72]|uniref:hypothetical protein n=1 Tax=Microbacterium sp. LRZ72 TaxID=2942481 RepID=UPI0029BB64A8|nr:hypothetical protein [Microbacterium sp. LRZ72]MDX2375960.1 hypothetical protein [Microbacterium sp. LRZ72]